MIGCVVVAVLNGVSPDSKVVEQLVRVEAELRAVGPLALESEVASRRAALIDVLSAYRQRGVFPHNHQFPGGRRPVFIDEHDAACAVAHLMMASGHERLAREIAARQNGATVREITHPEVAAWAREHGFTVAELAAIQPSYPYSPEPCDVAATWVASPRVSYLLTHAGHLWRLEASGRRSLGVLPSSFVTDSRLGGDRWESRFAGACSTDEDTAWFASSAPADEPATLRLVRAKWSGEPGAFVFEAVEAVPGAAQLYCTPGGPTLGRWSTTPDRTKAEEEYRRRAEHAVDVELEAAFFRLDEAGQWKALPLFRSTLSYAGSVPFSVAAEPSLRLWIFRDGPRCVELAGDAWVEVPCPSPVSPPRLVSRTEELQAAAKELRDELLRARGRSERNERPTFLTTVGDTSFSVASTSTPDCAPVLRDDVEVHVPGRAKRLVIGAVGLAAGLVIALGVTALALLARRRTGARLT